MDRNKLITTINDLFDQINNLRSRNEYLENNHMFYETQNTCECEIKTDLDRILIKYAKEHLYEDVMRSWCSEVDVWEDSETHETIIETYDDWFNNKIYREHIPEYMSVEEVKNIVFDKALKEYEENKERALKEFKENERKNGGK